MTAADLHPAFAAAAEAARAAYVEARSSLSRAQLEEEIADGADGTPTMRIDAMVEDRIIDATYDFGVNLLSEEAGFVDRGSKYTLVVDPLDGSANAAAGVPLACFSAALAVENRFEQALTVWLETGSSWSAIRGQVSPHRTTGRGALAGCALSLLRPHRRNRKAWWGLTEQAARVRILSCSTLEAALVLQGSTDAFADAGSDTHRLVDLAAAVVLLPPAGGAVIDAFGRPIELDVDQHRRWSGIVAATRELADEIAACIQLHSEELSVA